MTRLPGVPEPHTFTIDDNQTAGRRPSHRREKLSKLVLSITRGKFSLQFNVERRLTDGDQTASELPDRNAPMDVTRLASDIPAGTFWDALDPAQRQDFISRADEQGFAAGQDLMRQGEPANHVAMISAGRVQIEVSDGDRTRILAERGPGDLVGERAALQETERSATVAAIDAVRAWIMKTADFAAFVTAHPSVLQILEHQIYQRLSEAPASPHPAGQPLRGQNCTVVYTDVSGFAAPTRTDLDRLVIRRAIAEMTKAALWSFWSACEPADRGDGLLIIVPPHIPTAAVLEGLMTVLPARLDLHNACHSLAEHIQLRAAVTVGPITADAMGLSGRAIIDAARMLDVPDLKKALAQTGAPLGVIASSFVYEMAIKHGGKVLDPDGYFPVHVKVKESEMSAWMYLRAPADPMPRGGHLLAG